MPCRSLGLTGRFLATILFSTLLSVGAATPVDAQDLSGVVIDPQGRPVAQADVIVLRGTTIVTTLRTRANGRFGPVTVVSGEYEFLVSAPGLRSAPHRVLVSGAPVDETIALSLSAITESIVVSASQVDAPLSRVTDSVTVIDRAELDARQTETVADALRLVPGFAVVASGGRGAITSLFPRGGESDYTLVMADGIPLNSFGGGFDAAHLPTADLDRVEVVRGPQSALYGGGAIGGIVQLITRHGGPTSGRALFEAGGYGTSKGSASGAGSLGAVTWSGAFERLQSDGDTRDSPEFGGRVSNDAYERWDVSGGLGWADQSGRRVRLDVRHGQNERGFPGPYGSDPAGLYGGIDTISRGENETTGVSASVSVGDVTTGRHRAQITWTDTKGLFASPFGDSEDETRRTSARYQVDVEQRRGGISGGVEYLNERADNTFITGEAFQPVPVKRSLAGFFVEGRWAIADRASITTGARLERIERIALEGNPSPFGARPAFDDEVVWSANPKVSATVWLSSQDAIAAGRWTRLRMGAGTGIKPPTAFEIAFTDNPGLTPERSRSFDVGVEQALAHGTLLLDATWFANTYDDLIVAVGSAFSGASRYRTDNIANARARGLEAGVTWRSPVGLFARAALTLLDTEILGVDTARDRAPSPFDVGDSLVRRAPRQGSLEVHWASTRGSVFAVVNGRSTMRDLEPNFASTVYDHPGHAVVTAGGALSLTRGIEIFGRIANLLNRDYEDVLGFPAPGRVGFMGVRIAVRGR